MRGNDETCIVVKVLKFFRCKRSKNSVPEGFISGIKANRSKTFKETVVLSVENRTKHVNTLCLENSEYIIF